MSRPHTNRTPEKGTLGTHEKEKFSYYVVWNGRNPEIYNSWNECSQQVLGFKNSSFKGFHSLDDANAAFSGTENSPLSSIGTFKDSSSERCPNCKRLSLKIKLLEARLAYYTEKLPDYSSSSNDKSVTKLLGELGEMLEKTQLDG